MKTIFMTTNVLLLLTFSVLLAKTSVGQEYRVWQDNSGNTIGRAKIVEVVGTSVVVQSENSGTTLTLPFSKLSQKDRAYIQQRRYTVQPKKKPVARPKKTSNLSSNQPAFSNGDITRKSPLQDRGTPDIWKTFSKLFSDSSDSKAPVFVSGNPIIGSLPDTFLTPAERRYRKKHIRQTETILRWLTNRDVLTKLDESFLDPSNQSPESIEADRFYQKLCKEFGTRDDENRYRKLVDEARQLAGLGSIDSIRNLLNVAHKKLESVAQVESVDVIFSTTIELTEYDPDSNQFLFEVRGSSVLPDRIGGYSVLSLSYSPPIVPPKSFSWPIDQARSFLTQLGNRPNALVLTKVRLSKLRSQSDLGPAKLFRSADARILSISLHKTDANLTRMYQWELDYENGVAGTDKRLASIVPDDVSKRMEQLGKEFNLETFNGALRLKNDRYAYEANRNFRLLMDRVEIGISERFVTPLFAALHLPETINKSVSVRRKKDAIHYAEWLGKNEFDKRDSKARFWQNNRQKIQNLKYAGPLRVAKMQKLMVPEYDFDRGGFLFKEFTDNQGLLRVMGRDSKLYLPDAQSSRGGEAERQFNFILKPALVNSFLKVDEKRARKLVESAGKDRPVLHSVTIIDFLPIPDFDGVTTPMIASARSLTIYEDANHRKRFADIPIHTLPESFLVDPEHAVLPDRDNPAALDRNIFSAMVQQLTGDPPNDNFVDQLIGWTNQYENTWRRKVARLNRKATSPINDPNGNFHSPFLPHGANTNRAKTQWKTPFLEWQAKRLDSSQSRFKWFGSVDLDFSPPRLSLSSNYKTPETLELIEPLLSDDTNADQFFVINYIFSNSNPQSNWRWQSVQPISDLESIHPSPVLKLPVSSEKIMEQLPSGWQSNVVGNVKNESDRFLTASLLVDLNKVELSSVGSSQKQFLVLDVVPNSITIFGGDDNTEPLVKQELKFSSK